jgi:hypothetical protein
VTVRRSPASWRYQRNPLWYRGNYLLAVAYSTVAQLLESKPELADEWWELGRPRVDPRECAQTQLWRERYERRTAIVLPAHVPGGLSYACCRRRVPPRRGTPQARAARLLAVGRFAESFSAPRRTPTPRWLVPCSTTSIRSISTIALGTTSHVFSPAAGSPTITHEHFSSSRSRSRLRLPTSRCGQQKTPRSKGCEGTRTSKRRSRRSSPRSRPDSTRICRKSIWLEPDSHSPSLSRSSDARLAGWRA